MPALGFDRQHCGARCVSICIEEPDGSLGSTEQSWILHAEYLSNLIVNLNPEWPHMAVNFSPLETDGLLESCRPR